MVMVGQVGRDLVGSINQHSTLAVGMSGEDGGLFTAERRTALVDGEEVDLGLVGDVTTVRTEAIEGLINAGRVPVVAGIAPDLNGVTHNINADSAAAALAIALNAERLVVLTDVEGLYADWPNSTDVIKELPASQLRQLMPSLSAGMAPKMEACLRAVEGGSDPRDRHRRPGAARPVVGDLHQFRARHDGHPGRADPPGQPGVPGRGRAFRRTNTATAPSM